MRKFLRIAAWMGSLKMRHKLLLSYLLIFLLPVTAIGYFLIRNMTGVALEYTMEIHKNNLAQIETNIHNVIEKYALISDEILLDRGLIEFLTSDYQGDYAAVRQLKQLNDQYSSKLAISSPEARYRLYSDNKTAIENEVLFFHTNDQDRQSPWYKEIVEAKGYNVLGPSYFNEDLGRLEFTLGRQLISDSSDTITNILRIDIPESNIYEFLQNEGNNQEIYLFDEHNMLISSSANREYIGKYMQDIPGFAEEMRKQKQERTILSSQFEGSRPLKEWKLIAFVSNKAILHGLDRVVNRSLWVCLISFTAAFLLMLIFSNTLSKRLKLLVHNMLSIREGQMEVFVSDPRQDEIGELSRSFRKMVEQVNTLISEVYEKEIEMKTLLIQKRDAELHALQSQINPHFLFNTIESVRMHLVKKDDRETADIIGNFAKLFRRSLDWSHDMIPLKQEVDFVQSYLKIFRFRRKLEYRIDIDERLLHVMLPKFSLQPLVENAIHHGIEPQKEAGFISITGTISESQAILTVADNGVGIGEEKLSQVRERIRSSETKDGSRSIGLINVRQRINSTFGDQYGIEIESRLHEGTQVSLRIPYMNGGDGHV